jgi:outer membrane receptor protein involved in Fe transport
VYLFVNNVTNKIAALTIDNTSIAWVTPSIDRVTINQPRTAGVELSYKF